MRVCLLPTEKVVPLLLGLAEGVFDDHDVALDIEIVGSAAERDEGFAADQYDIVLMNLVSVPGILRRVAGIRCLTVVERSAPNHPMFRVLRSPDPGTTE